MKLQKIEGGAGEGDRYLFYCPGCERIHFYTVNSPHRPNWTFNGDTERPTFSPSLLMYGRDASDVLCHLFVREGRIEYCGDCPHGLAGSTVGMVEIPEDERR